MLLFIEKMKLFFAKHKKLIVTIIVLFLLGGLIAIVRDNYQQINQIKMSNTTIGVIGTLLGAIIGGVFTLIGTYAVNAHQIKAQNNVRRKNLIYKPLYDELSEIHNDILINNPYPQWIVFSKGPQTILKHPQYTVWGRIKNDSRYLETPKYLQEAMEDLYYKIEQYQRSLIGLNDKITNTLNMILEKELNATCTIMNIGDAICEDILCGKEFDLFSHYLTNSLRPSIDVEDVRKAEISHLVLAKCEKLPEVSNVRNQRKTWEIAEQQTINLLATMIKYINVKYEG